MAPPSPMWPDDARRRVADARVARLATVRPDGAPHVVPVTFALVDDDRVVTAVDAKAKTTQRLQRLANVETEPRVALLVDHYDEDWQQLWWARLDGTARVVREEPERGRLIEPLLVKYGQYADARPTGPVVVVEVGDVRYWSARRTR
ncbi:MAG TPA: TIGR03668 family PPOX class F420-dependent oxidoreductase [Actinomycetes bacterium]|nr:TIGR03668 family PPOX class F420-dependent oxidoreductase [Actinomycetes bacterium]